MRRRLPPKIIHADVSSAFPRPIRATGLALFDVGTPQSFGSVSATVPCTVHYHPSAG